MRTKKEFPSKTCPACGRSFERRNRTVQGWLKQIYCSSKCGASQRLNRIVSKCAYCERDFETTPSSIKNRKRVFCCMRCCGKYSSEKLPKNEQHNYQGRDSIEYKRKWNRDRRAANPDKFRHQRLLRYAREKGAEGSHTLDEWNRLKKAYRNQCAICKKDVKLTRDHKQPLSKGGSNYISNIQPLCASCNSKKHNKVGNGEAVSTGVIFF